MTCACESVHPFPCQFGEQPVFPFAGKDWCRFHLPLQNADGNYSAKGRRDEGWEENGAERLEFDTKVQALIKATRGHTNLETQVDFRGVAFPKGYSFAGSPDHTHMHVNFERATFGNPISFHRTNFVSGGNFAGATFYGPVRFDKSYFRGTANFKGVRFKGTANFSRTVFQDNEVYFKNVEFGDQVNFSYAEFKQNSFFNDTTFKGVAYFDNANFSGLAEFHKATFKKHVRFDNTVFKEKADFSEVIFGGEAQFSIRNVKDRAFEFQEIDFSKVTFSGPVYFRSRNFTTSSNFDDANFNDLVEFHGCAFHAGMSFHQTKFLKTKGEDDDATEKLERSYRTLKLEMEKLRARNEEADFFALEMECRRQRGTVPWFERFAATAYKHLSDYGRSVDLPLIWLLVLAYAAYYLYLGVALTSCNPVTGAGTRLAFTLEQMFRPFYVWAKSPPGTGNCLVENSPLIIPILASVQSLATIALLTLFLLALRRRFKMD